MNIETLPVPTKKRLIGLQQFLKTWNKDKITSKEISEQTSWKDSLIRHDLWILGFNKGVSNGYKVAELIHAIDFFCNEKKNICIVGLGRLGAALLDQEMFDKQKFCIKAGFDSNLNRVEILRSTFPLYPTSELKNVVKAENIELAILAVLEKDAQLMAEKLIQVGINGIVNMTNTILKVPANIKIENVSITNALLNIV